MTLEQTYLKVVDLKGKISQDIFRDLMDTEVVAVVRAHWIVDDETDFDICSNCNERAVRLVTGGQMDKSNYKGATYWNYCPHCGAIMDMDGRDNDRWQRPEELGVKECPVCGEEGNDE